MRSPLASTTQASPTPAPSPVVAATQTPTLPAAPSTGLTPAAVQAETPEATPAPTFGPTGTAIPTPTATTEPAPQPTATPTLTPTVTPTPAPLLLETWVEVSGVVRARTTSTSSISLPDGTIRTYFLVVGTIVFAESSDGRDLSKTVATNIVGTGIPGDSQSSVSNPAVLLRDDGMYLLVYEANTVPLPIRRTGRCFRRYLRTASPSVHRWPCLTPAWIRARVFQWGGRPFVSREISPRVFANTTGVRIRLLFDQRGEVRGPPNKVGLLGSKPRSHPAGASKPQEIGPVQWSRLVPSMPVKVPEHVDFYLDYLSDYRQFFLLGGI